jgi:hypothetical protein
MVISIASAGLPANIAGLRLIDGYDRASGQENAPGFSPEAQNAAICRPASPES